MCSEVPSPVAAGRCLLSPGGVADTDIHNGKLVDDSPVQKSQIGVAHFPSRLAGLVWESSAVEVSVGDGRQTLQPASSWLVELALADTTHGEGGLERWAQKMGSAPLKLQARNDPAASTLIWTIRPPSVKEPVTEVCPC